MQCSGSSLNLRKSKAICSNLRPENILYMYIHICLMRNPLMHLVNTSIQSDKPRPSKLVCTSLFDSVEEC